MRRVWSGWLGLMLAGSAGASNLLAPQRSALRPSPDPTHLVQGGGIGNALGVARRLAAVGDPFAMVNGVQGAGSVYIFALNDGINLNVLQRLFEPQPGHLYGYGQSTATDGRDWVMIGSSTDTPRFHLAGAVYVYRRDAMSGLFVNSQQLTASDVSNAWFFGSAIALGNGFALI
ncbi:MAG: hypothetical protein KGL00_10200, partial [Gammaproteobacteria bacterium]|nr:hypothetical protein [Gammaproteobacteria bacterium]